MNPSKQQQSPNKNLESLEDSSTRKEIVERAENVQNNEDKPAAAVDIADAIEEKKYIEVNGQRLEIYNMGGGEYVIIVPEGYAIVQGDKDSSIKIEEDEMEAVREKDEMEAVHEKEEMEAVHEKDEMEAVHEKEEMVHEKEEMEAVREKDEMEAVREKDEMEAVREKEEMEAVREEGEIEAVHEEDANKSM